MICGFLIDFFCHAVDFAFFFCFDMSIEMLVRGSLTPIYLDTPDAEVL